LSPTKKKNYREDAKKENNSLGNNDNDHDESGAKTTLGKWFPSALLVKCPVNYTNTGKLLLSDHQQNKTTTNNLVTTAGSDISGADDDSQPEAKPRSSLLLFYQYINTDNNKDGKWSQTQLQLLMTYLSTIAKHRYIGGRIRVAHEGVNVTVSAVDIPRAVEAPGAVRTTAKETLRHFVRDLQNFDPNVFASDATDFKYIDDLPPDRHFKEMKVMPVQELVFYGLKEEGAKMHTKQGERRKVQQQDAKSNNTTATGTGGGGGGVHLDADEYHEMLQQTNTVVIDVRNHYETVLGRFDGQYNKNTGTNDRQKESQTTTTVDTVPICTSQSDGVSIANSHRTGAEYLDPRSRSWVSSLANQDGKSVLFRIRGSRYSAPVR